jgi:hypothetical protein
MFCPDAAVQCAVLDCVIGASSGLLELPGHAMGPDRVHGGPLPPWDTRRPTGLLGLGKLVRVPGPGIRWGPLPQTLRPVCENERAEEPASEPNDPKSRAGG